MNLEWRCAVLFAENDLDSMWHSVHVESVVYLFALGSALVAACRGDVSEVEFVEIVLEMRFNWELRLSGGA